MREYRIIIANRPAVHKSAHQSFSKNTKNRVCQLVFFLTVWRIGFTIKHSIIPAVTEPVPMVSTAFSKALSDWTDSFISIGTAFFFWQRKTLIFSSEASLFRHIPPLFFVQCSCVLRVFHRGISLFSAEPSLYWETAPQICGIVLVLCRLPKFVNRRTHQQTWATSSYRSSPVSCVSQ